MVVKQTNKTDSYGCQKFTVKKYGANILCFRDET